MSEPHSHAGMIAFRYSNFTLFVVARFFLVAALEMQSVAVGWQIYDITRRPLDLGLVGLAQFLPVVFLFLPAGHAADRFNRKSLVAVCYVGFALCYGLLLEIARSAVVQVSGKPAVFVAAGESFRPVPVEVAAWSGDRAVLRAPLKAGVQVAVAGVSELQSQAEK